MINYKMLINKNNTIYNINLLNNKHKSIFFISFSCHGIYIYISSFLEIDESLMRLKKLQQV